MPAGKWGNLGKGVIDRESGKSANQKRRSKTMRGAIEEVLEKNSVRSTIRAC